MADSTASIKSLYSGRGDFSENEVDSVQESPRINESRNFQENLAFVQNAKAPYLSPNIKLATGRAAPEWYESHVSSTNISIASSINESCSGQKSLNDMDISESEYLGDSCSRVVSSNSNASGFSTTATKDGVEGKRPYRLNQRSLLNNVLAAKVQPNLTASPTSSYNQASAGAIAAAALPPISLDEKMKIMNREPIDEK